MTKARLLDSRRPRWAAEALPPARSRLVGRYTFTPATTCSAADAADTPRGDQAWVELPATGSLLSEFLTVLNATQQELGRRWNDQQPAT